MYKMNITLDCQNFSVYLQHLTVQIYPSLRIRADPDMSLSNRIRWMRLKLTRSMKMTALHGKSANRHSDRCGSTFTDRGKMDLVDLG